jgi:nitroreductase
LNFRASRAASAEFSFSGLTIEWIGWAVVIALIAGLLSIASVEDLAKAISLRKRTTLWRLSSMHVCDAVVSRYSCRAFLPTPVPEQTVRDIVEVAVRAPSANKKQPWRIDVIAGARVEALKSLLRPRMGELPRGEGTEYTIYPPEMNATYRKRRFEVGELLYKSIGVPREDKPARYRQYARNFEFFGAPVGIFFSIDRELGIAQHSDLGGLIQTVMLVARGYGLHSCAQQAWASWSKTLPEFLALPSTAMLYTGMALGYADENARINQWRSPRVPLSEFARFDGFD